MGIFFGTILACVVCGYVAVESLFSPLAVFGVVAAIGVAWGVQIHSNACPVLQQSEVPQAVKTGHAERAPRQQARPATPESVFCPPLLLAPVVSS